MIFYRHLHRRHCRCHCRRCGHHQNFLLNGGDGGGGGSGGGDGGGSGGGGGGGGSGGSGGVSPLKPLGGDHKHFYEMSSSMGRYKIHEIFGNNSIYLSILQVMEQQSPKSL